MILYVREQGTTVRERNGRFVVTEGEKVVADFPCAHVEQVVVFGNVQLSAPVVARCLERRIDVTFLSMYGMFQGRLEGAPSKNAALRQMQYAGSLSQEFRLKQACAIVAGKANNLHALARRHKRTPDDAQRLQRIERVQRLALEALTIEGVRGLEGTASREYFALFANWLSEPFSFAKREPRAATCPVNSLMDLSYTLVYNRIASLLNTVGLDPHLGCLHENRHGHAALASDLMEEFRAVVCDALTLKVLRKRMVQSADFQLTPEGYRLTEAAFKRFIVEFEAMMDTRRTYEPQNVRLSYRQIMEAQVRHYARVVTGTNEVYKPFRIK